MILECDACGARYMVADDAIGEEGRTVRCASCRHSWFQLPPMPAAQAARPPEAPAPETVTASEPEPERAPSGMSFEDRGPSEQRRFPAARRPAFKPRRDPAKRWTAAAMVAGVSMLLGAGAILYSGAPGIAAQLGLPVGAGETPLTFVDAAIDRRDVGSGAQLLIVSGRVVNKTGETQRVPDITVDLVDSQDRVVYGNWIISPGRRTLAPGGTVDFSSGRIDVPAASRSVKLGFAETLERR